MIFSGIRFIADSGTRALTMAAPSEDLRLQIVFGRAFLLELQRGDLERAAVFARAFLRHRMERPPVS